MQRLGIKWVLLFVGVFLIIMPGCQKDKPKEAESKEGKSPVKAAVEMKPTAGNKVSGMVTFTPQNGGVLVVADIEGLAPGRHGFHIHEKGDCSAPDGTSAGGHFNPDNSPHGAPDSPAGKRHVGDLGNLEAGADGRAHYQRVDQILTLEGPHSIVGKAVIIHGKADDFSSQPTGAAGPRLACGVIQLK